MTSFHRGTTAARGLASRISDAPFILSRRLSLIAG